MNVEDEGDGLAMNRTTVAWRGYWPAAPTPFAADGSVDEQALRALLELYRSDGVHGVLVNGTTGEWFSQSLDERRQVAEIAVEVLAGTGISVVIGCGSLRPADTIALAKHARTIGADGALTTVPPYAHPTDHESYVFFREVTEAVDLPWMVYNWPRGTAVDHPVDLLSRLADLERVVAIKDSTADEVKALESCEAVMDRVRFFGRFIHPRGLAFLTGVGGDGNIDGGGLGAGFAVPFYEAVWAGDLHAARTWSRRYLNVAAHLVNGDYSAKFASPTAQLKAAMNLLGQPGGRVRSPLVDLDDPATLQRLATTLTAAGLRPRDAS